VKKRKKKTKRKKKKKKRGSFQGGDRFGVYLGILSGWESFRSRHHFGGCAVVLWSYVKKLRERTCHICQNDNSHCERKYIHCVIQRFLVSRRKPFLDESSNNEKQPTLGYKANKWRLPVHLLSYANFN